HVMKSAVEQGYGPPYLARMLFAEIGGRPEEDLFLRVEYDGEIATNGATYAQAPQDFAVLSGTRQSRKLMEAFLKNQHAPDATFQTTLNCALDAWRIGHMSLQAGDTSELPERAALLRFRQQPRSHSRTEAELL